MYNVSNRFVNASLSSTREVSAKAVFNGTIEVDSSSIVDLTFEELCVAGDNPTMGEACSNKIVLNMYAPDNPPAYKSGSVEPYVGLTVDEDTVEYCPLGQFYISEYTSVDDYKTVQITAYDKMAMLNDTYTYTAPTTVSAVMSDIANQYDITVEDTDYPAGNLIDKVVKCTVRQMLGYIAGLMGKNVRFNKDGNLEFFWYTSEAVVFGDVNNDGEINSADINYINAHLINKVTGEEYESILGSARAGISYLGGEYSPDAFGVDVNADHIVKADDVAEIQDYIDGHPREGTIVGTKEYPYKATQSNIKMGGFLRLCDEMYEITKLESGSGSNIITSGTEGRMMSFENPFMTQAILDGIRAGLVFEYLPCTITYQGTPAFECGDIIGAIASDGTQYSVPIMTQTFVITGGMHAVINSVGTTDVQSTIEVNALEDILEPLEEAVENLEEKVGTIPVAEQIETARQEIESAIKSNLENVDGTYRILYNSEGKPYGWDIVSNTDSNKFWRFTYGGMRYTSDGGSTFSTGIDLDGNIYASSSLYASSCYVANTLTANAVLTNKVTAKDLTITGGGISLTSSEMGAILLANSTNTIWTQLDFQGLVVKDTTSSTQILGGTVSCDYLATDEVNVLSGGSVTATKGNFYGDLTGNKVFITNPGSYSSESPNIFRSSTGQLCIAGGSSKRWKHDITTDINSELNPQRLYDVEVVQFKFNEDVIDPDDERYGKAMVGFIAEQVSDVAYNYASHDKEGNCTDWNSRQMIPAMLKLIQEQKQQIDELTERVKVLEDGNI